MLESFFNKKKEEKVSHPEISPEDAAINQEINEMEDKEVKKDYDQLVEGVKHERDILVGMIDYIRGYVESHASEYDLKMPLGEFLDRIGNKDGFDPQIYTSISNWIDKKEGKINLEKSVEDFLSYAEEVLNENEFLLDPGPEVPPSLE